MTTQRDDAAGTDLVPAFNPVIYVPRLQDLQDVTSTYQKRYAVISAVIPAYNEESSIEATLRSLLSQTRPPDAVHVIVNNSTDDTVWVAKVLEGEHERVVKDRTFSTKVHVHDIGTVPHGKVSALNFGYEVSRNADFILGVDGDTTLDPKCVERLEAEIVSDQRIGGISAIYSIDNTSTRGILAKLLVAGQKANFAAFTMDNLLRGRNMAVLGGQCSLLRVSALREVMTIHRQNHPWVPDSAVEDSYLSLQLKSAGYLTKVSASARADVGAMYSVGSLQAQQVKWNYGALELLKAHPFHPNLRLRVRENLGMLFNILTRVGFLLLLVLSLSVDMFVFFPIWVIPPVIAWLLNIRVMLSMKSRDTTDFWFAVLFFTTEAYMILRIIHFFSAWGKVFSRNETDLWAAQAKAESGHRSSSGWLWPILMVGTVAAFIGFGWVTMSPYLQEFTLALSWPILGIISILLTLTMLRRLTRGHRGFTV